MPGKIFAALLLIIGGSITLYVLYKAALAVLQPVVQRKIEQQMQKEKTQQLQNNLQLHQQANQSPVNNQQPEVEE